MPARNLKPKVLETTAKRFVMMAFFVCAHSQLAADGTHSDLMARVDAEIAQAPGDAALRYRRAVLLFEHDDFSSSWTEFCKCEEMGGAGMPVQWWKARILQSLRQPEKSRTLLNRFLGQEPRHWPALVTRARVNLELAEPVLALADYRAAISCNPSPEPDLIAEAADAMASNERVDEAVALLETHLLRLGSLPSLQTKLVEIEVAAGRVDSALTRIGVFQETALRPELWMVKRAGILASEGRLTEAREAWEAILGHLEKLPAGQRGSHSMSILEAKAREAISILKKTDQPKSLQTQIP